MEGRRAGLSLCRAETRVINTEDFTSADVLSYPLYGWIFCWSHSYKTFRDSPCYLCDTTPLLWSICFSQWWPCTRHEHPWLLSVVSTKEENLSGFYKKLMSCRRPFLDLAPQECVLFCASPQRLTTAETSTGGAAPGCICGGDGLTWKCSCGQKAKPGPAAHSPEGILWCCMWWGLALAEGRGEGGDAFPPPSPPWAPVKELSIYCSGFTNHYNDRLWQ